MVFLSEISSVRAHCLQLWVLQEEQKIYRIGKEIFLWMFFLKALTFQFNSIHFENKKRNPYLKLKLKLKIEIETIFRSFVTNSLNQIESKYIKLSYINKVRNG